MITMIIMIIINVNELKARAQDKTRSISACVGIGSVRAWVRWRACAFVSLAAIHYQVSSTQSSPSFEEIS